MVRKYKSEYKRQPGRARLRASHTTLVANVLCQFIHFIVGSCPVFDRRVKASPTHCPRPQQVNTWLRTLPFNPQGTGKPFAARAARIPSNNVKNQLCSVEQKWWVRSHCCSPISSVTLAIWFCLPCSW